MRRVEVETEYDAPPERVWPVVISYDALQDVMRSSIAYEGLPSGMAHEGDITEVRLKLWGWLPLGYWTMRVAARDDAAFSLRSEEGGGAVKTWLHHIQLERLPGDRTRHVDTVLIDAGALTGFYAGSARRMYAARQKARRALFTRA